ncbi:uncharacterized protein si:ch211-108c6.2 [Pleuronectes platessa]|uniref:uncharacterized protein si:ch211-108c6.2 n=1 Tax=Pleuronectes platessa TaxID=8262 RepID=UPI00232A4C39|nr:uncharacterized protein si:ch211-108c6.2 [Pleuronectes platessa]
MGQNQEKLEGGEQAFGEGSAETRPCPDPVGADGNAGDVMEGEGSCEEEAGKSGKNLREPDTQDLDGRPGQEPTTPSSEKQINVWVSPIATQEVRQGVAAGKEGRGGGGGGGDRGRTAPVVHQETDKNQKSSAGIEERTTAYRLFNHFSSEERKIRQELRTSSQIKMEHQDEGTGPLKERQEENFSAEKYGLAVTSEDTSSSDNTEEGSAVLKVSRCGAHPGSEPLSAQDQNGSTMAEAEELCAGTVGGFRQRKEPPPAQAQHPLKNNLQKESLLDMSDTIHCRHPKVETETDAKEETLTCEVKQVLNDHSSRKPKVTDTVDQKESVRPYLQTDTTETNTCDPDSASIPVSSSSILQRLLKRNREEATPVVSKIKEDDKDTSDGPVEMNAKRILDGTGTEISSDRIEQSGCVSRSSADSKRKPPKPSLASKDHHIKDSSESTPPQSDFCESSEKSVYPKKASSNVGPSENLSPDDLQSADSHERTSCEENVIPEESAPSSVSAVKSSPTKSDEQKAESRHLPAAEKSGNGTVTAVVGRSEVQTSIKQDLHMTLNTPDQPDNSAVADEGDGISRREKSSNTPISRPVSELIKETIQMHEKLQHHDRPKPAEVKCDEQAQSVKVAQMKAAFDSPQKSLVKAIERKPSMRKGQVDRATVNDYVIPDMQD